MANPQHYPQHYPQQYPLQTALGWTLLALALPAWWWAAQAGQTMVLARGLFLPLHIAVNSLASLVAALVFVTGYRAMGSKRTGAILLLSVAFLGVALLDLLHTLSYAGMPDFVSVNTIHKSIFFWLCASMLAALALLAYASLPATAVVNAQRKRLAVLFMLGGVGALGFWGLVWPQRLPALFILGQGLTPLAITLEWSIVAIHLLTLAVLWLRRATLAGETLAGLAFAVALSAVSEAFLAPGVLGRDAASLAGLGFKVAAYLFLFHATFSEALSQPLRRLNNQHLREQQVLNASPDGILWVNQAGQILLTNPAMERLSGYSAHELVGQNVDIFLPQHLRARHAEVMRGYFKAPHTRAMGGKDIELVHRSGTLVPVDISLGFWLDGDESHAIAYVHDLSERKGFEASLRHRAMHDALTGLPNRWLFNLQLNQALVLAKRKQRQVAVLMLDLDDFKTVNDSFGHATGDALLVQVAQRLQGVLREQDTLARLGGDEFAILIGDLQHTDQALKVAGKLIAAMTRVFELKDHAVHSNASIGLAFYPADAQDSEDLVRCADMAMYQAKRSARAVYACYSSKLEQHARENLELHVRLKEALEQGRLKLFYQPKMDASGETIVGAEALLRWHDAVLGEVSPARFIPVAEATGLILALSDWVLETAAQQIAAWQNAGTPLPVAVNFSAQHFRQGNVAAQVSAALQRAGAPAHLLEIEITESIAMEHPEAAHAQLSALVALGCSVALDDFGTGYSSLAYLKTLPVSVLKIDRTFIKDLPGKPSDEKICRAIIALAHSLDMTLVAEGVETDAQFAFLRSYGCETFQGWLFAKAMSAAALTERLQIRELENDRQAPIRRRMALVSSRNRFS